MSEPVKIQINSLEALERLIGGNSEMEIELRKAIVLDFAKRHLKPLVADLTAQYSSVIRKAVQEEVDKTTREVLGDVTVTPYRTTVTFVPKFKEQIKVETAALVKTMVTDILKETELANAIKTKITTYMNTHLAENVYSQFKEKLYPQIVDLVNQAIEAAQNNIRVTYTSVVPKLPSEDFRKLSV